MWFDSLLRAGANVEICHVRDVNQVEKPKKQKKKEDLHSEDGGPDTGLKDSKKRCYSDGERGWKVVKKSKLVSVIS